MRSKRRIVTLGEPMERLVDMYASKHGVSFSVALVMILAEWSKSPDVLSMVLEYTEKN